MNITKVLKSRGCAVGIRGGRVLFSYFCLRISSIYTNSIIFYADKCYFLDFLKFGLVNGILNIYFISTIHTLRATGVQINKEMKNCLSLYPILLNAQIRESVFITLLRCSRWTVLDEIWNRGSYGTLVKTWSTFYPS